MAWIWEDENGNRRSPADSGNNSKGDGCCPMVEAVHALRRGKVRLSWRYARMSVRLIGGMLMGGHGRKPPNPLNVPKSHGRKPSAPKPRTGVKRCPMAAVRETGA